MSAHSPGQTSSDNKQPWICSSCGKKNQGNRSFCWSCEAVKGSAKETPPASPSQERRRSGLDSVVGIDLGTTNSVMAVMKEGKPAVIPNAEGERITPSVVAFDPKTGKRMVGIAAKRQAVTNPENTISSIKRFIGHKYSDPSSQHDIELAPYRIRSATDGNALVQLGYKWCSPPEVSAIILQKLKTDAEAYLGEAVEEAVITVPAYFNDSQRQATKNAARIAKLKVLRMINEPTAASLAYGLDKEKEETIAVYHLGGGTFDISILDIGENVFEVRSTSGVSHLGGDDFDQRIIDWLCRIFKQEQGVDLCQDRQALQRIREAAETAKCTLSTVAQTEIDLPFIVADSSGHKHLRVSLTREKLEELVSDLLEKTQAPCKQALADAKLEPRDIDRVILVGQQTRMPAVHKLVGQLFDQEPCKGIDPAEAVAMGAAIQAGVLAGTASALLLDVTPFTLSIETLGGTTTTIIERNTTIPTCKKKRLSTAADSQTGVEIHIVQGEHPMAADNLSLGRFLFDGIAPAPRGVAQIEVGFDIDGDGILSVYAQNKATRQKTEMTISTLSTATSEQMLEDTQARNDAEAMIAKAEKCLSEQSDDLPPYTKDIVNSKVLALRTDLQGEYIAKIQHRTRELGTAIQCIEALGESCDERAVELLGELLITEEDRSTREYLRQALRQIGGTRVDELLKPRTWVDKLAGRRRWVDI